MTKEQEILERHLGCVLQTSYVKRNSRAYNACLRAIKEALTIPAVVVSEERAELCDNPNCEDGIVDRDYYGHPIYCQVCESHN